MFCCLDYSFNEIVGKILVIVGYGLLGKVVVDVVCVFGVNVIISEWKGYMFCEGCVSFNDVLSIVDIISVYCLLMDEICN